MKVLKIHFYGLFFSNLRLVKLKYGTRNGKMGIIAFTLSPRLLGSTIN